MDMALKQVNTFANETEHVRVAKQGVIEAMARRGKTEKKREGVGE